MSHAPASWAISGRLWHEDVMGFSPKPKRPAGKPPSEARLREAALAHLAKFASTEAGVAFDVDDAATLSGLRDIPAGIPTLPTDNVLLATADCDDTAHRGRCPCRGGRLSVPSGIAAAAGGFPDYLGAGIPSGRESRDHGLVRRDAP